MGEVQAASAGHEELAGDGGHAVVDGDRDTGGGEDFRGHQAGWSGPDYRRGGWHG